MQKEKEGGQRDKEGKREGGKAGEVGRERDNRIGEERSSIHRFTPQTASTARAGSNRSQEPGALSRPPTWWGRGLRT